jgi:sulfide:quinone oxidoreductase
MAANRLRKRLDTSEWSITIVDQDDRHLYQPGFLFLALGEYQSRDVVRSRHAFIADGVNLVLDRIERVDPERAVVTLEGAGELLYDYLVIATGTQPRPEQTPGMLGPEWRQSIHEFYTQEGAAALAAKLREWDGGRLVVHVVEMPIKCPVAPLEFAFLADAWFHERGMRDRVELVYVTPLPGAFTKPTASALLGSMLDERKIALEADFATDRVDDRAKTLVSYDDREVPFDLLVTVPLNMGADYIAASGLGDELNYVEVDKHTLLSTRYSNIFAIGDASNIPISKAGSVAHFAIDDFVENFLAHAAGKPMTASFDGHANCFVESGGGRALLIDFNYDVEPLPGKYPLPKVGPFSLLRESRVNHAGKRAFRWVYWNALLPARQLPIPAHMSMAGKTRPSKQNEEA